MRISPIEYDAARKRLVEGEEAKRFLPFYRNTLKPILHSAIINLMSDRKHGVAFGDRELLALSEFAKLVEDMETILKRVVMNGERAEKVIGELLRQTG